jgi:hypothetical protein
VLNDPVADRLSGVREALKTIPLEGSRTDGGSYLGRAQLHGGMRLCTPSCRTCCSTSDASPCRNVLHSDCRLGAPSSSPRVMVRGNFAERATSRTEDGDVLSNDRFGGKSIRQREGASAFLHGQGLAWADKGPLNMSGTHCPWVACRHAASSTEAHTLS